MSNSVVTGLLTGTLLAAVLFSGCSSKGLLEPDASYVVNGKRYYTMPSSKGYKERGIASWYGTKFQGKRTSSGEPYDFYAMTAAHRSLPLPTYVEVENLQNGRSVIVKINDRGPFSKNRIIDLSYTAAVKLGILGYGTGLVEVRAIDTSEPEAARPATQEKPRLYLQAGAFRERRHAEKLRADIEAQKFGEVRIIELAGRDTLYTVRVGPLQDAGEVERINRELKTLGVNDGYSLLQ